MLLIAARCNRAVTASPPIVGKNLARSSLKGSDAGCQKVSAQFSTFSLPAGSLTENCRRSFPLPKAPLPRGRIPDSERVSGANFAIAPRKLTSSDGRKRRGSEKRSGGREKSGRRAAEAAAAVTRLFPRDERLSQDARRFSLEMSFSRACTRASPAAFRMAALTRQ